MAELPDQLHEEIERLCAEGDVFAEGEEFATAIARYNEAWNLLPEPRYQWEAATWILTALGDAFFLTGRFSDARDALSAAMHTPDAIGNPFIHLRLGQAQFELENPDRAADELMRAYMGAGPDIFASDDPKYIEFLATRARGIQFPAFED